MNHQQLIEAGLGKRGTSLRYPFDPDLPVLFVRDKMFAILGTTQGTPSISLKASPDEIWLQREAYPNAVLPGYHLNKRHWNTVVLNGIVPEVTVLQMLDESYRLVVAKLPKAERETLLMFGA